MKKSNLLKLFALMVVYFTTLPLARSASIEIPNFEINPGGTTTVPLTINPNGQVMPAYKGFQFDITVPANITIDIDATTLLDNLMGYTFSAMYYNTGSYRFIVYAPNDKAKPTTETDQLMNVVFKAASNAGPGTYNQQVNKVGFSSPMGSDIAATGCNYTITVVPADLDAYINIDDFSIVAGQSYEATVTVAHPNVNLPEYKGYQFDVAYIEGLTVDVSSISSSILGLNPSCELVTNQDGSKVWRFMAASSSVTSSSDQLMKVEFVAAKNALSGTHIMNITNSRFSSPGGSDITMKNSSTNVEIIGVKYAVTIEPSNGLTLQEGQEGDLYATVTVTPEGMDDDYEIVWTVEPDGVVAVDQNGHVTAKNAGTCTVTATVYVDGKPVASSTVTVTVTEKTKVTLAVDPTELELYVNGSGATVTAIISPASEAANYTVVWESSNPAVATVDQNGNVTPVSEGIAVIKAIIDVDGIPSEATCKVTVTKVEVTVTPGSLDLEEGESGQLTAEVEPEGDFNIEWSTSNPGVATVDQDGNVTAVGEGEADITVTVTDQDGNVVAEETIHVTVSKSFDEYTVTIEPSKVELEEGESEQLEVVIEPEYEGDYIVNWESSDEGVATVDEDGNVTAVGEGECIITGTVYDEDGNEIGKAEATVVVKGKTPEGPETPEIPVYPGPEGWYGNNNGTYVSEIKIREGNELGLFVNEAIGGYPMGWNYLWYDPEENVLGDEPQIYTTAELYGAAANTGNNQSISDNVYSVNISDYDDEDNVFWEETLQTATVHVYKRPQIPTQLLRKGQGNPEVGTSCTFVVMMTPLDNQQILDLGYSYVYGYTDKSGKMWQLDDTELRYTHTTSEIYWNNDYTFWAYSKWTYPDGSIVTSGLRYLDGSEDPDFDASVFDGSRASKINRVSYEVDDTVVGIYTIDGRYAGTDRNQLEPGIYIIRGTKTSQKVVIY